MRDIQKVLKQKEAQLDALRRDIDALRLVARLLAEEGDEKKPSQSVDEIVWKRVVNQ